MCSSVTHPLLGKRGRGSEAVSIIPLLFLRLPSEKCTDKTNFVHTVPDTAVYTVHGIGTPSFRIVY